MENSKFVQLALFILGLIAGSSMASDGKTESPVTGKFMLISNVVFFVILFAVLYIGHGVYVVLNMPSVATGFLPVGLQ